MQRIVVLFACVFFAFFMTSCLPKAVIPSAARLSKPSYAKAIHKERRYREKLKTAALANEPTYYNWERRLTKEISKLPVSERAQYRKNAAAQLVDSTLNSKYFYFNADYGSYFGSNIG